MTNVDRSTTPPIALMKTSNHNLYSIIPFLSPFHSSCPLQVSQKAPRAVSRTVALVAAMPTAAADNDGGLTIVAAVSRMHSVWCVIHDWCCGVRNGWQHGRRGLVVRLRTSRHSRGHRHNLDGWWDVVGVRDRLSHRDSLGRHHLHLLHLHGRWGHLNRLGHRHTVGGTLDLLRLHDDAADATSGSGVERHGDLGGLGSGVLRKAKVVWIVSGRELRAEWLVICRESDWRW